MKKFKKAFTLVELVIVIAVIAILAAVLIPTFSSIISKANESVDTQFVANLNKQLKIYSAENKIEDESDLWDFLIELYGENVNETLTPKAANKGNHFWYNTQTNTVQYGTLEDVNSNFERTSINSFDTNSLRIFNNKYYLLDKDGSDIAKVINKFENMTDGESYSNAINSLDQLDTNTKNNLLSKVQNTVIITDNGSFRYDSQAVENIYFAIGLTTITGKLYRYNNGVCGAAVSTSKNNPIVYNVNSITIPDTVKAVNEGALFFQEDETVLIYGDFKAVTEIEYIFKNNSTNGKIVCGQDKFLVDDNELTDEDGNSVGNLEYTVEVAKIKFTVESNNDFKVVGSTLYIAYYYREAIAVNASAYDKTGKLVDSPVVQGMLDNQNKCLGIETNGEVKVLNTPKDETENSYTITYSLYGYTDTLNIVIVIPKSGSIALGNSFIEIDNANYDSNNNLIEEDVALIFKGEPSFGFGELEVLQFPGSIIDLSDVKYTYKVVPVSGAKFTYDEDSKKITLLDSVDNFNGMMGKFDITIYDDNNNQIFTKRVVVSLEDQFNSPIEFLFKNTESYLYRVGNQNTISIGSLINYSDNDTQDKKIHINITNRITEQEITSLYFKAQNSSDIQYENGEYYILESKLSTTSLNFEGFSGVITISFKVFNISTSINLEVVDGKNVTEYGDLTNGTLVILKDIRFTNIKSFTNTIIYGNGFTLDVQGLQDKYTGIITIDNCLLDNIKVIASIYPNTALYKETYYSSVVRANAGDNMISNSYISGGQNPVHFAGGNLELNNTILYGGTKSNLWIYNNNDAKKLILNNVTTVQTPQQSNIDLESDGVKTVMGVGILVEDENIMNDSFASFEILGYLKQYNWVTANSPNSFDSIGNAVISGILDDPSYKDFFVNDSFNTGIIFKGDPNTGYLKDKRNQSTEIKYSLQSVSSFGVSCYVYSCVGGTVEEYQGVNNSNDIPFVTKQALYQPTVNIKYPTYQNPDNENEYYNYNSDKGFMAICYEEGGSIIFNLEWTEASGTQKLLCISKYGYELLTNISYGKCDENENVNNYISVTGTNITFDEPGNYKLKYSYIDERVYNYLGNKVSAAVYTKYIDIVVYEVAKENEGPAFVFTNKNSENAEGKMIEIDGKKYVSANISNASSIIYSATDVSAKWGYIEKGTEKIYFPIINGSDNNAEDLYRYYPIFDAIQITDGGSTYSKNNGTVSLFKSRFTYVSPKVYTSTDKNLKIADKEVSLTNNTFTINDSDGKGIVFKSGHFNTSYGSGYKMYEIIAVIEYTYTDSSNTQYTYFVGYHFDKKEKSSICVTPDTLVTLANGSQKEIQYVTYNDKLLVWSFEDGKYVEMNSSIIMNHGYDNYTVLTLNFSDGTSINTINGHGFYSKSDNKFIIINPENVEENVGKQFIKNDNGNNYAVTLVSYIVKEEYTESWSILTDTYYNCILEGMLTLTPAEVEGSPDYLMPFVINDSMTYDKDLMKSDIEKYGLYTYEDFKEYMSEDMFNKLNLKFWKVSVGKGYITFEEIVYLSSIHIG